MGIEKIRITGGEPFIRKDTPELFSSLSQLTGLKELTVTTNGVLTAPHIPHFKEWGIHSVNLSLDTIDRERFFAITRRDELPAVLNTLELLLLHNIQVKINAVVMEGKNTQDILPLVDLTQKFPVSVRFIEEMPFNGTGHAYSGITWNYQHILQKVLEKYPDMQKLEDPAFSTSLNYQIPGHQGTVGIIAAYSRSFCGTCNRLRITPEGGLKTCLYGQDVVQLRDLLRKGVSGETIKQAIRDSITNRARDGWEAEKRRSPVHESMATIGG